MKVLNLRCANGHAFEGWFGSDDDYMAQNGRGLVECPLCADKVITRLPTAPRLNLSGARAATERAAPVAEPQAADPEARVQALWLRAVQQLVARTEDVGDRFAEEARRIHYGEVEQRAIRGQATEHEREALQDEGIEVLAIPVPRALKGPVQ